MLKLQYIVLALYKTLKSSGGWVRKSGMADTTKTIAGNTGHMTKYQSNTYCVVPENMGNGNS